MAGIIKVVLHPWLQLTTAVFASSRLNHHRLNCRAVFGTSGTWKLKLTWLVLGEDPAARSHRVELFAAL